jgi:two-component system alkaline phosphatase synthesis response regulator PhoP
MTKRKILIVDDETYIRLLVRSILGRDYTVLEASNGEEAVYLARTQRPDLILMDIMMPKLDGVGACKVIKSSLTTGEIPVIMLSVREGELDQEYAKDMGADGYMIKPFSSQELLDTVNRLLTNAKPGSPLRSQENP